MLLDLFEDLHFGFIGLIVELTPVPVETVIGPAGNDMKMRVSTSGKKAGRISKRPSSTSGRRQRMAILLRNISWGEFTISETVFVWTGRRGWNI